MAREVPRLVKWLEETPTAHDGNNTCRPEGKGRKIMTRMQTRSSQQEIARTGRLIGDNDIRSNLITSTTLGIAERTPQQEVIYRKEEQCDMKLSPKIKRGKERAQKRAPKRRNKKVSTTLNGPIADERAHKSKSIKGMAKPRISESRSDPNAIHIKQECLPEDAGMDPPTFQAKSYGSQLDNTPPSRAERAPEILADALTDGHDTQKMAAKPPLFISQVSNALPKENIGALGKTSANQGSPTNTSLAQPHSLAPPRSSGQHAVHMVEDNSQSIAVDLPDKNTLETIVDIVINDHQGGIVRRRAMLDTGASVNVINHEILEHLGMSMKRWEGGQLTTLGGPLLPIGEVTLDWHVFSFPRTYRTLFVVDQDPDFDVLLGLDTIERNRFLLRNRDVYVLKLIPTETACSVHKSAKTNLIFERPIMPRSLRRKPRLYRTSWLRRDIPAERPGLTPMDSEEPVDIVVYPQREEKAGSDGNIRAQADTGMRLSLISMGMLQKAQVSRFTPCDQKEVRGSDGKHYKPIGKVDLLWCKKNQAKSYHETFYVIQEKTPMVIMGAPSFPQEERPVGQPISPIGLGKQTPEQKRIQEQKAKEVKERREKERKEQEEKEKRKRDPK
ncbi:MAG: hypothetical protein Q9214_000541 [Letrouitia sp. 1 TL-2023]